VIWARWQDRWPLAERSRFVDARPYRWHVQRMGDGPTLLFLHGAGGATHSWRDLLPLLARRYRCVSVDLPGHGFTPRIAGRSGIEEMAQDLTRLIEAEGLVPDAIVGHSAGAALALRLAQDRAVPVISFNGAFAMFEGLAAMAFPLMAKALAFNPLTVPLFTASVSETRARRLLEQTGSRIDAGGAALYAALMRDRDHVAGALAMMASWRLERLVRVAPGIEAPVLLLAGDRDGTVPPRVSRDMADRLPDATLRMLPRLGHLAHEEAPDLAAGAISDFLSDRTAR